MMSRELGAARGQADALPHTPQRRVVVHGVPMLDPVVEALIPRVDVDALGGGPVAIYLARLKQQFDLPLEYESIAIPNPNSTT